MKTEVSAQEFEENIKRSHEVRVTPANSFPELRAKGNSSIEVKGRYTSEFYYFIELFGS